MKIIITESQLKKLISLNILNEQYLGEMPDPVGKRKKWDVYKNPKSLRNMSNNLRGIVSPDGDLFIVDNNGYDIIHNDLGKWLHALGYISINDVYSHLNKYVLVVRYEDSYGFYLSEAYEDGEIEKYYDDIKKIFEKAKLKNPLCKFFIEQVNMYVD